MKIAVWVLSLCLLSCGIAQGADVRRSIFALDPNGPEITSLRNGIKVMQSRSASDPTSWAYQAAIHGTNAAPLTAQNTCQHGSFFFFSWHRMYLYYFERILRKASGDPSLTLPYWNYTDDPNMPDPDRRQLPLAFRQPANSSNPLYVSQRSPAMNDGTGFLPPGDVDYSQAFKYSNFEAPAGMGSASFGGGEIPQPSHFNGDDGALEQVPHNVVHGDIWRLLRFDELHQFFCAGSYFLSPPCQY